MLYLVFIACLCDDAHVAGGEVLSPNLSFGAVEVEFFNSLVRDREKKRNRYCLEWAGYHLWKIIQQCDKLEFLVSSLG